MASSLPRRVHCGICAVFRSIAPVIVMTGSLMAVTVMTGASAILSAQGVSASYRSGVVGNKTAAPAQPTSLDSSKPLRTGERLGDTGLRSDTRPHQYASVQGSRGRRDPFRLPPPPQPAGKGSNGFGIPLILPPGPKGLVISRLTLEGILAEDSGHKMIAVVTEKNSPGAYFLHADEPVYDGFVSRITPDAVYFWERGKVRGVNSFRIVVKPLNARQGEPR